MIVIDSCKVHLETSPRDKKFGLKCFFVAELFKKLLTAHISGLENIQYSYHIPNFHLKSPCRDDIMHGFNLITACQVRNRSPNSGFKVNCVKHANHVLLCNLV